MNCNCHEVLGGEADDAGVDSNRDVEHFVSGKGSCQPSNVELVVHNISTIIRTFAVIVGVKVR